MRDTVGTVVAPNQADDRTAMGLPATLVARGPEVPLAAHRDLLGATANELVAIAEGRTQPFARRYAAGWVLATVGDPRINPDDPPMVAVPGATVTLGLSKDRVGEVTKRWAHVGVIEPWIAKETPRYTTEIPAFRLMRYPVTNLEYRRFLADTQLPSLPTCWRFGVYPEHAANHPVWTVKAEEADGYARWLSARSGRRFRLPSEAEWEYAASGGDGREFPWGEEFDPNAANTVEQGPLTTTPIGIFPASRSPFGADDMAGNVEEYVADEYRPYPGGTAIADELQLSFAGYRIARGGSFTRFGDLARCRRRHGWFDKAIYAIGFRLAEDV